MWVGTQPALGFSVPELIGVTLVLLGGLLLALGLYGLGYLPQSTIRSVIRAGLAAMLLSDGPWILAVSFTASWPDTDSAHRISLETAHISLGLDALLVLLVALFGMLRLARRSQAGGPLLGSLLTGSGGFVIGYVWAVYIWPAGWRNGVQAWGVGTVVALIVAIYAVGQLWGRRSGPFSAREVVQLREIRERYRAKGLPS